MEGAEGGGVVEEFDLGRGRRGSRGLRSGSRGERRCGRRTVLSVGGVREARVQRVRKRCHRVEMGASMCRRMKKGRWERASTMASEWIEVET